MERYITFKQSADVTATSESFWRKLDARRVIRVFKLGRAARVLERDVLKFIAERERPAREARRVRVPR